MVALQSYITLGTSDFDYVDTTPTGIGTVLISTGGYGRTSLDHVKEYVKKHGGAILIVYHAPPLSVIRRFGKSDLMAKIVIPIYYDQYVIYEPRHRHDYPMLIRYFTGATRRKLNFKCRPAVHLRQPGSKDRLINKQKSFIKMCRKKYAV